MAACFGCKCNTCARNVNITPGLFTPGEIDECCFNCDDCIVSDGHGRWDSEKTCYSGYWKGDCLNYAEPRKYAEQRAQSARRSFHVIGGLRLEEKD